MKQLKGHPNQRSQTTVALRMQAFKNVWKEMPKFL